MNRLHTRVTGEYTTGAGERIAYKAADQDLLLWVHIAFMESFLVAHEQFAWREIPRGNAATGADNYVAQWSSSVAPLGLTKVPMSRAEMDSTITQIYRAGLLTASEDTLSVVEFIKNPPLPNLAVPIYRLLFDAAVLSLKPEFRQLLGLKSKPGWLIRPLTRWTLRLMRLAIGPESPIEDGAIARLRRIGAWA